ncbi:MFS transporter [Pseudogemmobacter faecipullorum]|nr:MFS transporter [Pseudogemmobacter faecipullorum]
MNMLGQMTVARPVMAAFAGMGIAWGSFAALMPDIKARLGVDESQLGFLLFFTPIAAVVAMLLAPAFGHRLGRLALPLAVMAMAAAFLLPGQVTLVALFPLAMMACGAATGLTDVLMNARSAELETRRGLYLMNLAHAAYSFAYAAGAIITGQLRGQGFAPAQVFLLMGLVIFLFALASFERDGRIHGLQRPEGGRGPGLGPVPVIGGGLVLIAFLTENATEGWSALHIEKTLGGSPEQGALGPATIALTMGIARLAGQGLTRRIEPTRLLSGGALIAACGALLAAFALSPAMAYIGFIICGIGASVLVPTALSLVGRLARDEDRGRAVARATLFGYFGYFVGPPALGMVAGLFSLRAAFVFAALVLLLTLVLAPLMRRLAARG